MFESLSQSLLAAGFVVNDAERANRETAAHELGMAATGDYRVLAAWTSSQTETVIWAEINSNPDDLGGFTAIVQHPAVVVVERAGVRCSINPEDVAGVVLLASTL